MSRISYRATVSFWMLPILGSTLLAACVELSAPRVASRNLYTLELEQVSSPAKLKRDLVLSVSEPNALAGLDTSQMAYVQQPYELSYYASSRWVDTPARMLGPLIVRSLAQKDAFLAVTQSASAMPADIRLDTELVRFQQEFLLRPSRVRITLIARLIDVRGKRLLGVLQIDEFENAGSEDAYGGVVAANRLVQRVLAELAEFCASESGKVLKSD